MFKCYKSPFCYYSVQQVCGTRVDSPSVTAGWLLRRKLICYYVVFNTNYVISRLSVHLSSVTGFSVPLYSASVRLLPQMSQMWRKTEPVLAYYLVCQYLLLPKYHYINTCILSQSCCTMYFKVMYWHTNYTPHHKMWGGGLYWIRFVASIRLQFVSAL